MTTNIDLQAGLQPLARGYVDSRLEADIRSAVQANGRWDNQLEWRISTVAQRSIECFERKGHTWYRVQVTCDYGFSADCPTLDRAIEFLGLFQSLLFHMWQSFGWPSWVTKTEVKSTRDLKPER